MPELALELKTALLLKEEGRYQDAEDQCRQLLQRAPNDAEGHYVLGTLLLEQQQAEEALVQFQQALTLAPVNGDYWLAFTDALLALDQPREALEIIDDMIAKGLDWPQALALQARAKAAVQRTADQSASLVFAAESNPTPFARRRGIKSGLETERRLHFLWTHYVFRRNCYQRYEYSNAEIVKYGRRYLDQSIDCRVGSFNSGRVTRSANAILLGHPSWGQNLTNDWVFANRLEDAANAHPNTFILVPWVPVFPELWLVNMPFIETQLGAARRIIGICGEHWFKKTQMLNDGSLQDRVKGKLAQVNMGIAAEHFPYKHQRSHRRGKFLHVSNLTVSKNIDLLFDTLQGHDVDLFLGSYDPRLQEVNKAQQERLHETDGKMTFSSYPLGSLDNSNNEVNRRILQGCDFYIHTSDYDAQATTVLENCARGLVPIITPESGFSCPYAVYLTQDASLNRDIIDRVLRMPDREYQERSRGVREHVLAHHHWQGIFNDIWTIITQDLAAGE